jgi:hypothetical protein
MSARACILPGLPPYGPPAIGFSATDSGLHSEGLVVEFQVDDAPTWVGNFIPGLSDFDYVGHHPNGKDILVISGGQAYLVDPVQRACSEMFGAAIVSVQAHPSRNWLILNDQDLFFFAVSPSGVAWRSPRVSWDGLRNVRTEGESIVGEAWEPGDSWFPFKIDVNTGELTGGSYPSHLRRA